MPAIATVRVWDLTRSAVQSSAFVRATICFLPMLSRVPPRLADAFVRWPALPVALAMIGGVAAGRSLHFELAWLPESPWLFVAGAIACLAVAFRRLDREWLSSLLLLASIVLGAVAATQLAAFRYPADHVTHYVADGARLAQLRLYLPNEPRLRSLNTGERFARPPRQATLATVMEILTTTGWRRASGDVLVQIAQPHPTLAAGQTVEAIGMLERPGIAMNPGQFDWQRYYRERGILNSFQVRRADHLTILSSEAAPLLTRWREEVRALLASGFSPERKLDHALLAALVLGDYDPELRDVKEQFRKTGTSHHLAISGMHVALVGGLIFLLARLIGFGPRACWLAALVIVTFYGCVAVPSPPVLRAVILFAVAAVAFLSARFTSPLQMLMLTVVIMLAIHPLDLFNAGFQLSFGTVLGLVLLSDRLAARWRGDDQPIFLPDEIARMSLRQRAARWADNATVRMVCAGVIAWMVSMPLVAAHFTQLNPWQVPASIALGPIVTVSLFAGVAKIAFTWLLPSSAGFFANIAAGSTALMRWLVAQLARLPLSDVPLAAPPAWLVALCWIALALVIVRWRFASVRLASFALLAFAFGWMLIAPYWLGGGNALAAGQMRVTLMSVGAGQCALVEPSGERAVMIDCGSDSLTDLTNNVVAPVLRERGRTSVDTIFVSHADTDHYGGVAEIAGSYGTREVVVADSFGVRAGTNSAGSRAMAALTAIDLPPRVARPGDRVPLGKDSAIEILWPPPGAALEDNDESMVVRLWKGDRSILFAGDIQTAGMKGLLASGIDLHSDVLVAPHHGSSEDVTPTFVAAVAPRWVVASDDRTPSGKQKRFDAMMATQHRPLFRTHDYGAITLVIDAGGAMRIEGFAKGIGLVAGSRSRAGAP